MEKYITEYVHEVKNVTGNSVQEAVLYGSYARGENTDESDIDIALFTNNEPKDFYKLIDQISETTFEYNVKYNVIFSPVFVNKHLFDDRKKVIPFYQNIEKEGIAIG